MPFEFDPNLFPDDDAPSGGTPPPAKPKAQPKAPAKPEPSEELHLEPNRPAEGALRSTAEEELNQSWQGGVGASDFLGLDEELRAPRGPRPTPTAPTQHAPQVPYPSEDSAAPSPQPRAADDVVPLFDDLELASTGAISGAPEEPPAEFDFGSDEGPELAPRGSWLLNRDEAPLHVPGTPSSEFSESEDGDGGQLVGAGTGTFGTTFVEYHGGSNGTRRLALAASAAFILALGGIVFFADRGTDEVRIERSASTGGPRPTGPLQPPPRPAPGFAPLNDPGGPPPPRTSRTPLSQADVPLPSDEELLAELVDLAWSARNVTATPPPRLTGGAVLAPDASASATPGNAFAFAPLLNGRGRSASPWTEAQQAPAFAPCELDPAELAVAGATIPGGDREAGPESGAGEGGPGGEQLAAVLPTLPQVVSLTEVPSDAGAPLGAAPNAGGSRATRTASFDPDAVALLPGVAERLSRATEADLENLWPGIDPPLDQFAREHRLLTPRVGRVRIVLDDDELFEGRLYAIGENRLWIDTTVGRIAFPEGRIADVQRISGGPRTAGSSTEVAGLERVGVRVPGGTLYGRLVKREGDRVTIVPDGGGRMTLEGATVEAVGRMRTTIVSMAQEPESAQVAQ